MNILKVVSFRALLVFWPLVLPSLVGQGQKESNNTILICSSGRVSPIQLPDRNRRGCRLDVDVAQEIADTDLERNSPDVPQPVTALPKVCVQRYDGILGSMGLRRRDRKSLISHSPTTIADRS